MIKVISGSIKTVWLPIKPSATIYMGSFVCVDLSSLDEGIIVRGQADGEADTTNKDRPFGVAVGHNLIDATFSSTYHAEYITDEGATGLRASTTNYSGIEGPFKNGGKRAMVEVALITPSTLLRAPFRNNGTGTIITVLTSTAGNANGLTVTTGACDFTPVADLNTIFCRSGANANEYRITNDTSTTVAAWDVQMLSTTATTGETYVRVPVRHHGPSYVRFGDDTVASYVNVSETSATHYDIIHVTALDLQEKGNEWVEFYFDSDHFCSTRA